VGVAWGVSRAGVPVPVALRFAYDGGAFDSFARQTLGGVRTVEDCLLGALEEVGAVSSRSDCGYRTGSRTDKGVSARENVVAFRSLLPADGVAGALWGRVEGLWPLSAVAVAPGFDPRNAKWREYRYFLAAQQLGGGSPGDLARVLGVFVGRHDFSAFARWEEHRDPRREILESEVWVETGRGLGEGNDMVVVRVRGVSFLWQQVRRMIQAALAVVRGEAELEEVRGYLSRQGELAPWGLAPSEPLVLWRVYDPRLNFQVGFKQRERMREVLVPQWGRVRATMGLIEGLLQEEGRR
jgi:tRNA pseudouridine38-40 synthase